LFEQLSATASLLMQAKPGEFDILHAADPDMALQLKKRSKINVIYKDGLLLGPQFCSRFDHVQVLAPHYLETAQEEGVDTSGWFVIPHLVNIRRFAPAPNKSDARRELGGIPEDAFVVLAVGDFSPASNKRLDWIVSEVAKLGPEQNCFLCLVGQATEREFEKFGRNATEALRGRVKLFRNLNPDRMATVYQAADVFAHAATREPFGIVFLEAMASGLPILGHHFPVTKWIVGDGGLVIDMTKRGALADALVRWIGDAGLRASVASQARDRATTVFAEEKIVPLYQQMYERVASGLLAR
jgi:glycosyltransferase involved in cell wall biosynthesis